MAVEDGQDLVAVLVGEAEDGAGRDAGLGAAELVCGAIDAVGAQRQSLSSA